MATPALTPQNYYSTSLAANIGTTDTTIYINGALPTGNEGYLEIGEGLSTKEIIYFTSKGSNFVTLPSALLGRGIGGTSAAAHTSGEVVKQKLNAEWWLALQNGSALSFGSSANLAGGAAFVSWTPTFTGLTIGNGTLVCKYTQIGKLVTCRFSIVFGSTTAVTGGTSFTLPVTAVSYPNIAGINDVIGRAGIYDSGVATYGGVFAMASTTTAHIYSENASVNYVKYEDLAASLPIIFSTGDIITGTFAYEAA